MPSIINDESAPIGAIQSAILTEAQFQAQFGTGWVLADGRSVAGSKYAIITLNATIPDLRGMVLRGKNNGRSDGNQDPDGERAVGSFQGHQFDSHNHGGGSHSHTVNAHNHGGGSHSHGSYLRSGGGKDAATGTGAFGSGVKVDFFSDSVGVIGNDSPGTGGPNTTVISSNGGNETRMRNVAVNHFIKIN